MDENACNKSFVNVTFGEYSKCAVNSLILDYYKKFGRKRDLEQFFSLSTAQGDIRDPSGLFWRKMKLQNDSSGSGEGKSGSSNELCKISIRYTAPEPSTSQINTVPKVKRTFDIGLEIPDITYYKKKKDNSSKSKDESVSPPIITDGPGLGSPTHSANESVKSDDNNSQKSTEAHLDTSINKLFSPTSSITSQRKLEWDSLGDVGYGNESERKASSSGLSTLERLALHQQYSNNDTKQDPQLGVPTSHSTPVEPSILQKGKKGNVHKTTKIYKKDIDFVELNVPQISEANPAAINVNLTKHISFNVDKDGEITIKNSFDQESEKVTPDKISVETEMTPLLKVDKEMQTTLTKKEKSTSVIKPPKNKRASEQTFPVMISLNALRKRSRKKKLRTRRKTLCKKSKEKTNMQKLPLEKSGNQVSEAESFEYMPGHIYNPNQINNNIIKDSSSVGNKSSLESSVVFTTDSSKASRNSFTKDLEKSIDFLKEALHPKYNNTNLKEKLIKNVVQRLLKARYSDDDSATVFLSGLTFNSKSLGLAKNNQTTTSTSEANTLDNNFKRPKKSILRVDKFNPNGMASTSQSTPNLHTVVQNDKSVKTIPTTNFSNTESDWSSRERNSSDSVPKMSSEELYQKYVEALKREQLHKKLLKHKESLFRKKLVSSDTCIQAKEKTLEKSHDRLYKMVKDLARNNLDNGSGDASKFEGGSNSNKEKYNHIRSQKTHSVFTLASGKSVCHDNKNRTQNTDGNNKKSESSLTKSENHYCCCANRTINNKSGATERAIQVDEGYTVHKRSHEHSQLRQNDKNCSDFGFSRQLGESTKNLPKEKVVLENTSDVKYVCLCSSETVSESKDVPEKLLIYKCSRLGQQGICLADSKASSSVGVQFSSDCLSSKATETKLPIAITADKAFCVNRELELTGNTNMRERKTSSSSQTKVNFDFILRRGSSHSKSSNEKLELGFNVDREISLPNKHKGNDSIPKLLPESTRWIQTKISIDPKISDPSLSDVNFVNDVDCAKLVSELERSKNEYENLRREQFKNCIETQNSSSSREDQTDINNCYTTAYQNNYKAINEYTQTSEFRIENKVTNIKVPESYEDKFSIPIQGTNMTLVVSLGTNAKNAIDEKITNLKTLRKNQALNDKATSFDEVIAEELQLRNGDIVLQNDQFERLSKDNGDKENTSTLKNNEDTKNPHRKSFFTNTCAIEDGLKYNTYPNKYQSTNIPFLRSNTDTGRVESYASNLHNDIKRNVETQKNISSGVSLKSKDVSAIKDQAVENNIRTYQKPFNDEDIYAKSKVNFEKDQQFELKQSGSQSKSCSLDEHSKDPILSMIQDITKRYTKNDTEKSKRRKCFKEIMTVLNYLLDTEESTDQNLKCSSSSITNEASIIDEITEKNICESTVKKNFVDKGVQLSMKKRKKQKIGIDSSDMPTSSELPTTSTDSATCKVLNKIRNECEKYHQKRCKSHHGQKNRDESSSTSVLCENCNNTRYCSCRHKCKSHKPKASVEKLKKKCVAYNLILQTSDSMASEETIRDKSCRPLQNIIVKVPPKHKHVANAPFKEVSAKIEKKLPHCSPRFESRVHRSRSLPNDSALSSEDIDKNMRLGTVRDYLEINRPDFIEKSTTRQNCLKLINQTRSNERAAKRKLLSLQLERQQTLNTLTSEEIQQLARELGSQLRRKKVAPKFISEREMKKHSEKIYKSLPEVVQKKEEMKKENTKKTNLLMANIFKKNLQQKTLRGSVNLSNYSTVVKI